MKNTPKHSRLAMNVNFTKPEDCKHSLDQQKFFTIQELEQQDYRHFLNEVLRHRHLLTMMPSKMKHVIDVGCGTGYMAYLLAQRGLRVTAVDISEKKLLKFRDMALHFSITQVHLDLFQLHYDNIFDALVCQEVLEHLEHYEKAVKHISSFLRTQGYALFCVPYKENLAAKIRTCPMCNQPFHKNGHVHSFNEKTLSRCIENQELTVLKIKRIVSKRTTKWFAKIQYPAMRIPFPILLFDRLMNLFFPRKAAYLAVLCRKNNS